MPDIPPACGSCIFRLDQTNQTMLYRQTIGSGVCGKGFGPTEVPVLDHAANMRIGELKASRCGEYSNDTTRPRSMLVKSLSGAAVTLPDPEVLDKVAAKEADKSVTSCLGCANYITPQAAMEQGLWNIGLCAARGLTIAATDVRAMAEGCPSRRVGYRDGNVQRMALLPEYAAGMQSIGTVGATAPKKEGVEYVEPTEYPTDADVSDEHVAMGIRAWREVKDPDSDNSVYLPIYDLDFFTEDERAGIPRTGDDEHPEEYVDHQGLVYKAAVLWMKLNETPALWGVAGTGKTEFYRHMAWLMVLPFNRISVTGSTEIDDLAGKMHYDPSRGTYFEYGRIPNAWQRPGIICLDEPNVGPPEVWQFIRPLTDNSKQLVLDMNNGERVPRHPSAFLGMAMNPAWDIRNSGTASLADADGSRLMHIYVDLPNEKTERAIIRQRCLLDGYDIPDEMLDAVMKIAKELRALCADDTLPITWGIRPQIKVARALRWFAMPAAYRLATADYLEPEQQAIILDTVKAHVVKPKKKPFAMPPTMPTHSAGPRPSGVTPPIPVPTGPPPASVMPSAPVTAPPAPPITPAPTSAGSLAVPPRRPAPPSVAAPFPVPAPF